MKCAIVNGEQIDFSKESEPSARYMQRYAEVYKSSVIVLVNASLFLVALGFPLGLTNIFLSKIFGVLYIIVGFIVLFLIWRPRWNNCKEIILNAEKRLVDLSENRE